MILCLGATKHNRASVNTGYGVVSGRDLQESGEYNDE